MPKHITTKTVPVPAGQDIYEVFAISRKTNKLLSRYYGPAHLDALSFYNDLVAAKSWRLMRINGIDHMQSGAYE